jgi:osmotically-inducible protein OsmY
MHGDQVESEIRRVLDADPTIREAAHILVSVEKRGAMGLGREVVMLRGRVHDSGERVRVEKIAAMHGGGRQVVDAIRVQA